MTFSRSRPGSALVPFVFLLSGCSGSEFHAAGQKSAETRDSGTDGSGGASGGTTSGGGGGSGGAAHGGDGAGGHVPLSTGGTPTTGSGGTGVTDGGFTVDGGAPDAHVGSGTGGDGAGGCGTLTTFFPDGDGDQFGRSTGTVTSCEPPAGDTWAILGGDCDDDSEKVFPKSKTFYEDAHSTSGGTKSFDYDCSGTEDGDPAQIGAVPTCSGLLGIGCTGTGYMKTARTGPGVNALCGSRLTATCKSINLTCTAVVTDAPVAYRCK